MKQDSRSAMRFRRLPRSHGKSMAWFSPAAPATLKRAQGQSCHLLLGKPITVDNTFPASHIANKTRDILLPAFRLRHIDSLFPNEVN